MGNFSTNTRKEQAAETKNKLYACAEQLFRKNGFDNVSVDEVVKSAGVSKGTFYVHFDSKASLIAALIADYVERIDTDYQAYLESIPDDAPASQTILSLVAKIVDVITDTIGYDNIIVLYKVQITKTVNTETTKDYNRGLYSMFNDVISKGIRQGEYRTDWPVESLSRHFVMALRGLTYEWCIRHPDFNLKEEALRHFQLLVAGLKTDIIS